MQLDLQQPDTGLVVRRCTADHIVVSDQTLSRSFLLSSAQIIQPWRVTQVSDLDEEIAAQVLALNPSVFLLGTGTAMHFPPQAWLATLLRQRVGVEAMSNAAAARTFNVLAAEGRSVWAGFILPTA